MNRRRTARTDHPVTLARLSALRARRADGTITIRERQELGRAERATESRGRSCAIAGLVLTRRSAREALREMRRVVALASTRILRARPPRRRAKRPRASRPHAFRRARSTPARGPDSDDTPSDHPRLLRVPGSCGREGGR
jgi:hypothetical protein